MRGPRVWAGEFIGTLMFVTVGAGSVIVANTGIAPLGVFGVAAAHGLTLSVVVTAFVGISGAHVNPAVTLSLWVGGRMRLADAAAFIVAQVLGAVAAGALLLAMLGRIGEAPQLGTPGPRADLGIGRVIVIEATLTFFVVIAMWATVIDERGNKIGGFGVGLMLFAGMLFAAQLTGGVFNPARHLGPALISGSLRYWWVYWVGPGIGGVLAGIIYPTLLLDRRFPWRLVPASDQTELPNREPPAARKGTRGR